MQSDLFRKRVETAPENELFRFSLGQALFEEGAYAEAIEHLKFCSSRKADWMVPLILLGKACLKTARKDEAREALEKALALAVDQNHEGPEAELREILADLEKEQS